MAASIYHQCIDKQRIIITGAQRGLIANMARHILAANNRKFDWYSPGQPAALTEAPVILIDAEDQLLDYHPHILILSEVSGSLLPELEKVTNALSKGGVIIYPEDNRELKALATRERADIQAIPYSIYRHELKNGVTTLITSTNEKFPIALKSPIELKCVSATREVLKKIGISSGQFYKAVSTFQP